MMDFLIITRDEFTGIDMEHKIAVFGREFYNVDCPSVVNVCFRCCTLGQTFNDDFSLTRRRRKSSSMIVSKVIPPCTLSKVRLMMMCFIHKFIQGHYLVKLNVMEHDVHRYIGESVFFHDRLVDLFVKEAGDPTQHGVMDRNDIYIMFDMRRMKQRGRMCTVVYVGEYLTQEFCRELDEMHMNFFPKVYAIIRMGIDESSYDVGDDCHRREIVVNRLRIKSMADELNDFGSIKFTYFNTVGGLYINKSIDKKSTIMNCSVDVTLKEAFDVYGFVVALFCQVFEAGQVFSTNAWKEMYEVQGEKRIRYYVRDWIANDGSVKTTLKYECDHGGDVTDASGLMMENAYNTVVKDFNVDLFENSRGYVPFGSPKKLMKEYVVYDRSVDREFYEDRGRKHLYEWHHDCKKKQYCDFCREGLRRTNYKRGGDFYQVENEEMSCANIRVSYDLLDKFLAERSRLDKNSKDMMFNMLIPPPVNEEADSRVRWVYVTELEKD